jgi:Nitroreductase family
MSKELEMKMPALRKILAATVLAAACSTCLFLAVAVAQGKASGAAIAPPAPRLDGPVSVEMALAERRSVRAYKPEALSMDEVPQILWAAQGITESSKGYRTAPSARGTYVIQAYLAAGNVSGPPAGLYRYEPKGHALVKLSGGIRRVISSRPPDSLPSGRRPRPLSS